jgi:ATP-dependent Clp protease ATP-binding subunit ClpA
MDMFERFSGEARQVVVHAQTVARDLQHDYIGTEHVLLGLFDAPASVPARALRQLGLTKETVKADVEKMIGRGKEPSGGGHIPFTPRAKKVLELALREALKLKHNYIGTEHILLGLVREGEGVAARIMVERIGDLGRVRGAVLAEMGGQPLEAEGGMPLRRHKTTGAAEDAVTAAEALAGGAPIGSHHLLEALVRAEGSMAARVLADLGVDPEVVAAKIDELDPETTTDATPEESAARKMELRLAEGEVQLVFRDREIIDLTEKVIELTGGPIRGTGPVAGAFVPLWTSTNDLMLRLLGYLQAEPEEETRGVLQMMRRVMRGRLQSRRRPPEATG